ncbi:MAG: AAA family ATPase [Candidatus Micrarchaeota archaeon]|nr:AAA family ATPase [Candidatus Micrarchaeota archaeon]
MAQNIFRRSASPENQIFKNEEALLPDFLPQQLPGREREIQELVFCLKPAAEGKQPQHALLFGPSGTGKTTVARFVLKELSEYSQHPLPVYVNCWERSSRFSVFSAICDALGEFMPRRGIAADEIFGRIVEIAKKEGRVPVVVLDEADRLCASQDGLQVLYDLCRAGEVHSLKIGAIAITNDEQFHIRLDPRVRSSFIQNSLAFSPYSALQLREILRQRSELAFMPGALEADVVPLCAAVAFKNGGDARVALHLLLSAGKEAERQNASRVCVEHVRQVQSQSLEASSVKAERKLPQMDEVDQKIVALIKEAGKSGIESGKLYEKLRRTIGERALRNRIEALEKSGIISTEELQLRQGRTRLIRIKE